MANNPSTNGVRTNSNAYDDNEHTGLEKERRVRTNNPPSTTPSPRGHA